jgi:XTP/dITP diphosphohydrolase
LTQIYCATSNPGKLAEFRLAADAVPGALPVAIELLPGFAAIPPCVEDGATFAENALIKARHYGRHTAGLLFADDSGLVVDALQGAPGVHSARFSGLRATNQSNNRLLLEKLRGVKDRAAAFVCTIALVKGGEPVGVFTGRVEGAIIEAPRGANGFGYDPLFFYPPFGCTFGEAGETAKFAVSHRGQALREMLRHLAGSARFEKAPA